MTQSSTESTVMKTTAQTDQNSSPTPTNYHVAGWWRASQCFKLVYNFDDDHDSNVFAKMKILQTDLIGTAIDKRILFPKAYQVT